ncbi:CbiX/SirB N-terminal domain-containing protein [Alkaliphilus hydrothermalis]|uniref:Protoheme ferro-lyase n=1 Tax=Alkaliphilus hydrothermalis TaxID=1482730 RepID=A0ABS2NP19_9FIRM|nr:ferrochelatase [Alkaliphilus hydrothermalis]MBM7614601.1 protoheme ferro-lyase [Alkaliphilus hydrothermalis]
MVPMIFLMISILLGMICGGNIDKLFLILSGFLLYRYCFYKGQMWKDKYKQYLIGLLTGYLLVIVLILCLQYRVQDKDIAINYVENQKTAIVLVLEGEPATYNLPMAIKNFRQKNKLSFINLPFQLYKNKYNYSKISSINTDYYYDYFEEEIKKEMEYQYPIYIAYLYNRPYMKEVLQEAIQEGNDKLMIVPVLLSESKSFQLMNEVIKEVNPLQYKVKIKNSFPLWDSEALAQSFVDKISQQVNVKEKSRVGILLVGEHDLKDINSNQNIKQEILFKEKVKDLLIKEGYSEPQIRLTPLKAKEIHMQLERLFEYGIKEVVVMQVSSATENIENRMIISQAIDDAEVPQYVSINFSSGWLYNDTLILELVRRIQLLNIQNWD